MVCVCVTDHVSNDDQLSMLVRVCVTDRVSNDNQLGILVRVCVTDRVSNDNQLTILHGSGVGRGGLMVLEHPLLAQIVHEGCSINC